MRDHRKLKAFQLSDQLVLEIYQATKCFPSEEQFGLTSQMRRAATSVPANIVEGCARRTRKEFLHFLSNAFASLRELGYFISLAPRLKLLSEPVAQDLKRKQTDAACRLRNLIKSLE